MPDYLDRVDDWHDAIAALWDASITAHLPYGGRVALLIWGDPSLYDSSLRIAERLRAAGREVKVRVIPGLTSLQMLTARHAIPLNTLGGPVQITTGRQLRDHGWPDGVATLAVMLDGSCAFADLPPEDVTSGGAPIWAWPRKCWMPGRWPKPGRASSRRGLRRAHGTAGSWTSTFCGAANDRIARVGNRVGQRHIRRPRTYRVRGPCPDRRASAVPCRSARIQAALRRTATDTPQGSARVSPPARAEIAAYSAGSASSTTSDSPAVAGSRGPAPRLFQILVAI